MTLTRSLVRLMLVTAFLLLIPLVAMQFTTEVTWTLFDFVVAGTLLFGTGLAYELVARLGNTSAYRMAVGAALAVALLLVWTNLAVGLIGSENNPANLLYGGVLAVGLIGAILARFRPLGMVRTLYAVAFAQALVPVIALVIWRPQIESRGILEAFGVTTFFVVLWVGSALLFRRASAVGSPKN
ncbi:hypothetical protein [Hymenobacter sp. GOD-10R]|uniref:hypothetical protein n=1 Tax=Hymenobacter sp. GOD-10R TaxID=3093922 RepID=UPI002D76954D|nr:hypothetical protein [Hymenobacter sp. GOD-10R]WRQ29912.1 hypothetical protein SD425_06490 [Hymenobacter sp. GOD-10R]